MAQTRETMDPGCADLIAQVLTRADADAALEVDAGLLLLAALTGDEALDRALASDDEGHAEPDTPAANPVPVHPPATRSCISSIAVQGFRGIGARSELHVVPGPGLTLVVGRNGSGKSSFAEALELLLTGENRRWAQRSAVWKRGWRNLHWSGPPEIEATFAIEGERQPLSARRAWAQDAADEAAGVTTVRGARRGEGLAVPGWKAAISTYRPFLPYNELGSIPDSKPSELYDMMSAALGLDALVAARERLRKRRLVLKKQCDAAESARQEWFPDVDGLDDERARTCAGAIQKPRAGSWKLDDVELVLDGAIEPPESGIVLLRQLAALRAPGSDEVGAAAKVLEAAVEAERTTAATDAGRARQLADLLHGALAVHTAHGDRPCPICGEGRLTDAWRARTEAEVIRLREEAATAARARRTLEHARRGARGLLTAPPEILSRAGTVDVDAATLRAAWDRWTNLPADAADDDLVAHLQGTHGDLSTAAASLRDRAAAELERREDAWRPLARRLREWLPDARRAVRGSRAVAHLRAAEKWLQTEIERLRAERFRPIAERAAAVWALLRQNSSVALASLTLAGTTTSRHVALDVSVDGTDGQALGVMSQGEIHALALSLFLPRVLLPESPFGFVVIDDPVQAMDPGKVDGLARVLAMVAQTRQVVVFTHDERLPESVRRLQIPAQVVEVTRRAGSVVECRPTGDPVTQYLDDARALLRTDRLPPPAAARAVSLFCRLAIEAACTEAVRRRRIGRGEPHADVEATLMEARTLLQKLALALFDDAGRAGEVLSRINRGSRADADAVAWANRGPHEEDAMETSQSEAHIEAVERVTQQIRHRR